MRVLFLLSLFPLSLFFSLSFFLFLFLTVFRNAYNLVLQKHGELLYKNVSDCFRAHTLASLNEILKESDEKLLFVLLRAWEDHRATISMLRDVVMYMDRTYVVQHKLTPVYEKGLSIFRETIIYNTLVRNNLQQLLLTNILNERNGELIDVPTMKGILYMFLELSIGNEKVYETEFERNFLTQTESYYRHESYEYITQHTCIEYVQKIEDRLKQEQQRILNYLSKSTEKKLNHILETELIANHAHTLVGMEGTGCRAMLEENNVKHLKQLCLLLYKVPIKLQLVRDCIGEYIKKCGSEIISDQDKTKEKPVVFVENILQLKEKFDHIIHECLQVMIIYFTLH
jgi:cullin 3